MENVRTLEPTEEQQRMLNLVREGDIYLMRPVLATISQIEGWVSHVNDPFPEQGKYHSLAEAYAEAKEIQQKNKGKFFWPKGDRTDSASLERLLNVLSGSEKGIYWAHNENPASSWGDEADIVIANLDLSRNQRYMILQNLGYLPDNLKNSPLMHIKHFSLDDDKAILEIQGHSEKRLKELSKLIDFYDQWD